MRVNQAVYYGGRDSIGQWMLVRMDRNRQAQDFPMPDRLAVEQQLARVIAGLAVQDQDTIKRQRRAALDPQSKPADEVKSP